MEVKKYLPMAVKNEIINSVVEQSIEIRDGMKFINNINKQIAIDLQIVGFYSDVDISVGTEKLYEDGIIDEVKSKIPLSELNFIEDNVYFTLEQEKEVYNSLSAVVSRGMNSLIDKLDKNFNPKAMKGIIKEAQKLDLDKMPAIKQAVDLLKGNVNK